METYFPSEGKAHCRILFCRQRYYDCVARSLRHSLLVQRNAGRIRLRGICARKHAQGTAPRSEPRFAPADRDEAKNRGSMRLRPPRPPGERASRESQNTEILRTAEKVSVFGAKPVCSASRAARPDLAFPSRGRLTVGLCFSDRDFVTSSPITSFSFSAERKRGKKKDRSGGCAAK